MNGKKKCLTAKQRAAIDDLFEGRSEEEILAAHNIDRRTYNGWLEDSVFMEELAARIKWARLHAEVLISRHAQMAAITLLKLTECEKEETARKACLDVMSMPTTQQIEKPQDGPEQSVQLVDGLTEEMAGKLLERLAEG